MQEIASHVFIETDYPGVTLGAINWQHGLILIDAPFLPDDIRLWRTATMTLTHSIERLMVNLDEHVLMEMARSRGLDFKAPKLDGILKDNDHIHFENASLDVLHTPGHTPGCISIKMTEKDGKRAIFTGDIASTTGRLGFINGPGFDLRSWKTSIKRLISESPDRIYPGHGTFMLSGGTDDLRLTDVKMNAPWTTIVTSVG